MIIDKNIYGQYDTIFNQNTCNGQEISVPLRTSVSARQRVRQKSVLSTSTSLTPLRLLSPSCVGNEESFSDLFPSLTKGSLQQESVLDDQQMVIPVEVASKTGCPLSGRDHRAKNDFCKKSTGSPQDEEPPRSHQLGRVHLQIKSAFSPSNDNLSLRDISEQDLDILAKTIYGEARGEWETFGLASLIAVGNVVANRLKQQTWFGRTVEEICRKPYQFSCWNPNDPNRKILMEPPPNDAIFDLCRQTAEGVLLTHWPDLTKGADHYVATSAALPPWAQHRKPLIQIGNHIFYKI